MKRSIITAYSFRRRTLTRLCFATLNGEDFLLQQCYGRCLSLFPNSRLGPPRFRRWSCGRGISTYLSCKPSIRLPMHSFYDIFKARRSLWLARWVGMDGRRAVCDVLVKDDKVVKAMA